MKIMSDCMACMISQVKKAFNLLRPECGDARIVEAQRELMGKISSLPRDQMISAIVGRLTYSIVGRYMGTDDPYKELKKKYNDYAMELYPKLKNFIDNADDPTVAALKICIMGNTVDFGAPHRINLTEEFERTVNDEHTSGITAESIRTFLDDLKNSAKIMILGDNTGEIVFDKIFIETVKKIYPEKEVVYSVRSGPIINDATVEDAQYVGLTEVAHVVVSSATPGIYLPECSSEFVEAFNSADLILSKGQGNFEAILDLPPRDGLYFLLKIKCGLLSELLGHPEGTLILMKDNLSIRNTVEKRYGSC